MRMYGRPWLGGSGLALCLLLRSGVVFAGQEECIGGDVPNPAWCFPDVLCNQYQEYWDYRRSVVHIYGPDIAGTGALINNAACQLHGQHCGTPYILTAHHVVSQQLLTNGQRDDIENLTAFTFDFEAGVCGGPVGGGAIALVGATILAASPGKDLLLLQLNTSLPPELGAYFLGWGIGSLDQGVVISHPCGAPKRIAISEPGAVHFMPVVGRDIYNVSYWEEGATASGSSGAALLDEGTGSLHGVFTEAKGSGAYTCFDPSLSADDWFTALSSILPFLPNSVSGGHPAIDHYDSNEYAPIAGVVEDSSYYGEGEAREIWASQEVRLLDGFWATAGSTIVITVGP